MLENYFADPFGVIHQRCVGKFEKDYAAQYNNYGELSNYMAYLRFGYMMASCKSKFGPIRRVLDIGYGNGAFLKVCNQAGMTAYGYDISQYPVPEGCKRLDTVPDEDYKDESGYYIGFDVITMFDSFEHFNDINFVYDLPTNFLIISVPNCHSAYKDSWFEAWKHRRPNEHLHHFNYTSLKAMLEYENRYTLVDSSYIEDVIRKGIEPKNILTMVFKKGR